MWATKEVCHRRHEAAGDGACLSFRASLSAIVREIQIRAGVAPVRAAELSMVVYFADNRLYRRIKYGATDLTLQFAGIRVDEQSGLMRHGFSHCLPSVCRSSMQFLPGRTFLFGVPGSFRKIWCNRYRLTLSKIKSETIYYNLFEIFN